MLGRDAEALPESIRAHAPSLRLGVPEARAASPLFAGALHFVAITYRTSKGSLSVAAQDLATAQQFARLAAGPIAGYAGQYGPAGLTIADAVIPFTVDVPSGKFTDATLKGWVNGIVQSASVPSSDGLLFLNPQGVDNQDAPTSQGVLGYHGFANVPYGFVNVLGTGFSVADANDVFALALSHEIAELVVDPRADATNPEVCDPCGPNCQTVFRDYFDGSSTYLGSDTAFPPAYSYAFYLNAIVQPGSATACPAPAASCAYSPP